MIRSKKGRLVLERGVDSYDMGLSWTRLDEDGLFHIDPLTWDEIEAVGKVLESIEIDLDDFMEDDPKLREMLAALKETYPPLD